MSWIKQKFKEFAKLQRGFDLPEQNRIIGVYPVIASTSITAYHNAYKVEGPCVTTGRSGALGEVLFIRENCWPLNTVLWVKDFCGNDPKYVYFKLKTLGLQKFNSGAGVPTLNRNHLDNLEITIPCLQTQNILASVLSAYDDLIELNEKRIKTLEEMAQRLYTEWFVKFKFPGHEKVKLVDSGTEFGRVPEGWEVGGLANISNAVSGYAFKSSDFRERGIPIIKIKNIESDGSVSISETDKVSEKLLTQNMSKYILSRGDIIVAMTGATAGKTGRIFSKNTMLLNQRVAKINPKNGYYSFVWGRLGTDNSKDELYRLAGGAAQPNMSTAQIENIPVLIPINILISNYEKLVYPILEKILLLQEYNQSISSLRDLLIPQLVAGTRKLKEYD